MYHYEKICFSFLWNFIMKNWIETLSGIAFDLDNPTSAMVNFDDVATSLSRQCRYNGHCSNFYSIAEHSIHCTDMAKLDGCNKYIQLLTLIHDAHEAFIGDIVRPIKVVLGEQIKLIEERIDEVLYVKLGIKPPSNKIRQIVKSYDDSLLTTEASTMMASGGKDWYLSKPVDHRVIFHFWQPAEAKEQFILRFSALRTGV